MKTAVITGATGALGTAVADILSRRGITVVNCSRGTCPSATANIALDLTNDASIEACCQTIEQNFGDADCLINTAGIMSIEELEHTSFAAIERVMATNIIGMMKLTTRLVSLIKRNRGDIVNVGSTVGFKAYASQSAYGVSKWAVRGFTESLQLELKDQDVRVIGFYPGGFQSKIFEKATGKTMNLDAYMNAQDIAQMLVHTLDAPRQMEVSSIIINRRNPSA